MLIVKKKIPRSIFFKVKVFTLAPHFTWFNFFFNIRFFKNGNGNIYFLEKSGGFVDTCFIIPYAFTCIINVLYVFKVLNKFNNEYIQYCMYLVKKFNQDKKFCNEK